MARKQAPVELWRPREDSAERATITRYMRWLAEERGVQVADYGSLWRWSVEDLDGFWASIWDFFDVRASRAPERVTGSRAMPGAEWFPGARLSYAEHIFRGRDDTATAVHHASELRGLDTMTWGELRGLTARIAGGLRALGVTRGDRVVAYMPNLPETLAAFLACASIGAVWSSCSPDFGERSVVDRFAQIEPKVLLAVDGYRYNGKDFDRMDVVAGLEAEMQSVEYTVLLPYLSGRPGSGRLARGLAWEELLSRGANEELAFEQLPFNHPLWVLYSSGTTGLPKAIVHGQGGILLEHLKKMNLHLDAQLGDRVFWFTTTGWMMWNFLVGVLLTPAEIVLYDGSPAHPDLGVLWDLAERTGTTCFGTSAAYVASCMKGGARPRAGRELSALRSVGSTGSPLSPEGFRWVYDHVGEDTWLFSTSGGTDVCTAFVGGCPLLPVHLGELQCRALGAKVEAFDEQGNALVGEVGELVITEPMPSMPIAFWDDPGGERMRESYFSTYPGVWRHGDWIEITDRGTAIIHGRSDSTINRGGVRMGTSEIYRAVLVMDQIVDALVVDAPSDGELDALFVVLRAGVDLDGALRREIARRIREGVLARHVPDEIIAIDEVPRTLSGKLLEVPVKRILMGAPAEQVASRDSLQNPAALDPFVELAARRAGVRRTPSRRVPISLLGLWDTKVRFTTGEALALAVGFRDPVGGNRQRMDELPGTPASLWVETSPPTDFPALDRDVTTDVAVLGGGIAGLTSALLLAQAGASVVLVDAGKVGRGVSGYSTAKISSLHSLTYADLVSSRGEDHAQVYGEANEAGLATIARLARELAIDCDLRRRPNFTYTESENEVDDVREEAHAAAALGLPASFVEGEIGLPWDVKAAVRFEDQAEFHPCKYLVGLAQAVRGAGGEIFEHTRAVDVSDGDTCTVQTENGREVQAGHVIVATHFPFLDRAGFFARMHPERSYCLAARVRGSVPQGMYISTKGHSLRSQPAEGGGELLLVGGESHKVGQADEADRVRALDGYARERFDVDGVDYRWSTQDNIPLDSVPYVGKLAPFSKRVLVATGFRKWGYTNGTAAAIILADAVKGREHPWASTFDSSRLGPASAAATFVKENLNVGRRFVQDRLKRGSAAEVAPGEGAVVRDGLRQAAVHRDEGGNLHAVSARCTHLGCLVEWNSAERSWDCPCHGSRFGTDGRVLQGPAVAPLEPREPPASETGRGSE